MTGLFTPEVISGLLQVLLLLGLVFLAIWIAAFLLERSLEGTNKLLRMAFKAEFTTDAGKLNVVLMLLITFLIVFSSLHDLLATALRIEGAHTSGSNWIVTILISGIFFWGSIFVVSLLEKKK